LIDANPALVAGFFNCSRAAFVFAAEALAHGNPLRAAAHDALRDESFKCRITIAVD
jgi:predicted hotdog family 3-hydroxylacyl-ACP dehydratase